MAKIKKEENISNNSGRMLWADVTRIIAIYLVIQVHSSVGPSSSTTWLFNIFSKFDVISVPLFIMLSGSLLLGKKEKYYVFFKKRFRKVLMPWIIWTFIYMFYLTTFSSVRGDIILEFFNKNSSQLNQWLHFLIRVFLSNFWFLPLIFGIYLITPLLRILVQNAKTWDYYYLLMLWFLVASIAPYLFNNPLFPRYEPSLLLAPFQYVGLFLLGYVVIRGRISISLPLLFLFSILPLFVSFLPIDLKYIKLFSYGFLDPGTVFSSVFFFLFLFSFLNKFEKKINLRIKKIIRSVSGASLGVYFVHGIVVDYLKVDFIKILYNYNAELLLPFIMFIISICFVLILQKVPILQFIVP